MGYSDRNVHERIGDLAGRLAESAAVAHMAAHNRTLVRYGFDQLTTAVDGGTALAATWPAFLRHTPDFVGPGHFYEVQGCGADRTFTFKADKLTSLQMWAAVTGMPVRWLLYVQPDDTIVRATMDAVLWALHQPGTTKTVLDADSKSPKSAWLVPLSVLLDVEVVDAFSAQNAHEARTARAATRKASE